MNRTGGTTVSLPRGPREGEFSEKELAEVIGSFAVRDVRVPETYAHPETAFSDPAAAGSFVVDSSRFVCSFGFWRSYVELLPLA